MKLLDHKKLEYKELDGQSRKRAKDRGLLRLDRYSLNGSGIQNAKTPVYLDRFLNNSNTLYGFELEIEAGSYVARDIARALDIALRGKHYVCYDGSLRNGGLEIVSAPLSASEHRANYCNYYKMLRELRRLGCTSHDNGRCGLHVHCSKTALNSTDWHEMCSNIYANKADWIKLSRRIDTGYCRFNYHDSRYVALNFEPAQTREFRFWRGTLEPASFLASLELTFLLVEYYQQDVAHTHDSFLEYARAKSPLIAGKYLNWRLGDRPTLRADGGGAQRSRTLSAREREYWKNVLFRAIQQRYGTPSVTSLHYLVNPILVGRWPERVRNWLSQHDIFVPVARAPTSEQRSVQLHRSYGWGHPARITVY